MLAEMFRKGPIRRRLGAALSGILLLLALLPVDAQSSRLGPGLAREMERGVPPAGLRVIVKLHGDDLAAWGAMRRGRIRDRQDRVLAGISAGDYEMLHRHEDLPGFVLRAGRSALRALERHPEVERVYLDGKVYAQLTEATELIGATISKAQGFSGAGVTVAVVDTGIDTDHIWLMDDIVVERCWCNDGCCPPFPPGFNQRSGAGSSEDGNGHGTAVSGIITSPWPVNPGVAPDAGIASLKVLDDATGTGHFSDVDKALAWVLANHATYNIRVVNMSLGDSTEYPDDVSFPCSGSVTSGAIDDLTAAGISVVVASGNNGYTGGVDFPACVGNAIAVGGVYDASLGARNWSACNDTTTFADKLVCHTNRGGGLLDVLAPDWKVDTTWNTGDGKSFSGTSAAAPFVAATAAVLYSNDPSLTAAQVRTLITSHGPLIPDPGMPSNLWPRIAPAEILTSVVFGPDSDSDGVSDDGDGSGLAGDDPCSGGNALLCDDNCPFLANTGQDDPGGVGAGSAPNGIGTACECGDLDLSGVVDEMDAWNLRLHLADPNDPALPPDFADRCQLLGGGTGCGLLQAALLLRNANGLGPPIEPVCSAATGL